MNWPGEWAAHDGVFGGYVVARLVEAAEQIDGYAPLSISVQFTGAVRPGPGELRTDVVHQGALTASVQLEVHQAHRRALATVKSGRPAGAPLGGLPVDLSGEPAPEQLPAVSMPYGPYPYEDFLTTRLIPDAEVPWWERMRAWVRIAPAAAETLSSCAAACVLLDALPPGLFFDKPVPIFVPTVDFTAHFAPSVTWRTDAWVHVVAETRWATRDFCLDQAVLRTPDGRLVAQAVQTRRVLWSVAEGPR